MKKILTAFLILLTFVVVGTTETFGVSYFNVQNNLVVPSKYTNLYNNGEYNALEIDVRMSFNNTVEYYRPYNIDPSLTPDDIIRNEKSISTPLIGQNKYILVVNGKLQTKEEMKNNTFKIKESGVYVIEVKKLNTSSENIELINTELSVEKITIYVDIEDNVQKYYNGKVFYYEHYSNINQIKGALSTYISSDTFADSESLASTFANELGTNFQISQNIQLEPNTQESQIIALRKEFDLPTRFNIPYSDVENKIYFRSIYDPLSIEEDEFALEYLNKKEKEQLPIIIDISSPLLRSYLNYDFNSTNELFRILMLKGILNDPLGDDLASYRFRKTADYYDYTVVPSLEGGLTRLLTLAEAEDKISKSPRGYYYQGYINITIKTNHSDGMVANGKIKKNTFTFTREIYYYNSNISSKPNTEVKIDINEKEFEWKQYSRFLGTNDNKYYKGYFNYFTQEYGNTFTQIMGRKVFENVDIYTNIELDNGISGKRVLKNYYEEYYSVTATVPNQKELSKAGLKTIIFEVKRTKIGNAITKNYEFEIEDTTAPLIVRKESKIVLNENEKNNFEIKKYLSFYDDYNYLEELIITTNIDSINRENDYWMLEVTVIDQAGNETKEIIEFEFTKNIERNFFQKLLYNYGKFLRKIFK